MAAASAHALNCVVDADIDAVMKRTARRPLAKGQVPPAHALIFGLVLGVRSAVWLGLTTNWLAAGALGGRHRVLRAGLHAAAQAADLAEHRLGRRRRLHAGGDRLGRGHRHGRLAGAGDVRRDLLLDAAALLGARHALPRGLRRGRVPMLPVVATPAEVSRRIVVYSWVMAAWSLLLVPATSWIYAAVAALGRRLVRPAGAPAAPRRAGRGGGAPDAAVPPVEHVPLLLFAAIAVDAAIGLPVLSL